MSYLTQTDRYSFKTIDNPKEPRALARAVVRADSVLHRAGKAARTEVHGSSSQETVSLSYKEEPPTQCVPHQGRGLLIVVHENLHHGADATNTKSRIILPIDEPRASARAATHTKSRIILPVDEPRASACAATQTREMTRSVTAQSAQLNWTWY